VYGWALHTIDAFRLLFQCFWALALGTRKFVAPFDSVTQVSFVAMMIIHPMAVAPNG
jgi:hypothetical protein